MKELSIFVLFLVVFSFREISAARLARSCQNRWAQGRQCMKDGLARASSRDQSFPVPSDSEKSRLKDAINSCFVTQQRCKSSPIPSTQQERDRSDCFNQVKQSLNSQLEQCVRKCIDGFSMPDDIYDPNNDWLNYIMRLVQNGLKSPIAYCGLGKKGQLQECAKRTGYDFMRKLPNKDPPYWCRVEADCWFSWGSDCQNTWEYQVEPQLCQCAQDMLKQKAVRSAQDQFKSCLKSRGQNMAKDDPVLKWIDNYLRSMCFDAQNHPCRREREAMTRRQGFH